MSHHTTAVSVFSNDVSMTVLRSNAQTLTNQKTEAGRVEHCSTADDTMHRQATQFPCDVRHHIHYMSHNSFHRFTLSLYFAPQVHFSSYHWLDSSRSVFPQFCYVFQKNDNIFWITQTKMNRLRNNVLNSASGRNFMPRDLPISPVKCSYHTLRNLEM